MLVSDVNPKVSHRADEPVASLPWDELRSLSMVTVLCLSLQLLVLCVVGLMVEFRMGES